MDWQKILMINCLLDVWSTSCCFNRIQASWSLRGTIQFAGNASQGSSIVLSCCPSKVGFRQLKHINDRFSPSATTTATYLSDTVAKYRWRYRRKAVGMTYGCGRLRLPQKKIPQNFEIHIFQHAPLQHRIGRLAQWQGA